MNTEFFASTVPPAGLAARPRRAVAIRAKSIDTQFLHTLRHEGLRGRVHSVFERVVNIECAHGELFTLACSDLDDAPSTAILELSGFGATGIEVGDPVVGAGDKLRVGECLVIVPPRASRWDCIVPGYPQRTETLRFNLHVLQEHLEQPGTTGGMLAAREPTHAFEAAVAQLLDERAAALQRALERSDLVSACEQAKGLLGLGPGLTPSGDDFLVGLFAVLNIAGSPCHRWLRGGADVLGDAVRSTHAISVAALAQAARGCVRESIVALIEHLMYGTPGRLAVPLRRVLAIGSSSGADIVAGVRCGFELNLFHETPHEGRSSCQSR